jgi:hypothetical protein
MLQFRNPFRPSWKVFALPVACLMCAALVGAKGGAITRLKLDPEAPVVELFDGIEQGKVEARLSASNAHEGKIFITNKTDKPLTVAVPKAVVGVRVVPQIGPGLGNNGFGNFIGNQNGPGNQNGGNGQAQNIGGMVGAQGNNTFPQAGNGVQNQFPGNNFFSIPPEKTVQLKLSSVCLNYGRPEPSTGMKYKLVKVESYTTDPVLQQLLEDYSPRTNREAQQAAAWHVANGLSWEQIAQLTEQQLAGLSVPRFTEFQVNNARELVKQAEQGAAERPSNKGAVGTVAAAARK